MLKVKKKFVIILERFTTKLHHRQLGLCAEYSVNN